MVRKCSHCGKIGHNLRTCSTQRRRSDHAAAVSTGGGGRMKLFGVHLRPDPSRIISMKKSFSVDCLKLSSHNHHIFSDDHHHHHQYGKISTGYFSDGLINIPRTQEKKKSVPWSEEEHRRFLVGLEKLGKGDWRGISRNFVTTRTPTQVASHAQKYFIRVNNLHTKTGRRPSLFDKVEKVDRCSKTNESSSNIYSGAKLLLLPKPKPKPKPKPSSVPDPINFGSSSSSSSSSWDASSGSRTTGPDNQVPGYPISAAPPDLELTLGAPDPAPGPRINQSKTSASSRFITVV